eukprot:s603_g6.t1
MRSRKILTFRRSAAGALVEHGFPSRLWFTHCFGLESSVDAGCMVFYGVQYVLAKLRSTYNGAVFQWFMASGALFTGLGLGVILVDDVPGGTQAGLLGGALVAVSNAIILHLKRTLGLFTGVVVYQAANLITGYCVGRFGFLGAPLDPGKLPWLRDIGVVLLLISLQLVSISATISKQPEQRVRAMSMLSDPLIEVTEEDFAGCDPDTISSRSVSQPGLSRAASEQLGRRRSSLGARARDLWLALERKQRRFFTLQGLDEEEVESLRLQVESSETLQRRRSWPLMKGSDSLGSLSGPEPLGEAPRLSVTSLASGSSEFGENLPEAVDTTDLATQPEDLASQVSQTKPSPVLRGLGGILAVAAGVPFAMWHRNHPNTQSACFVFPMALGVWASSTVIYLGYTSCKKMLHLRSPAKPSIRPAFLSGCLWAAGFACFAKSLDDIRYTATYMLSVIGPVLVSQLISVFVFKEIKERGQLRWFACSCFVQFAGMTFIILGT